MPVCLICGLALDRCRCYADDDDDDPGCGMTARRHHNTVQVSSVGIIRARRWAAERHIYALAAGSRPAARRW